MYNKRKKKIVFLSLFCCIIHSAQLKFRANTYYCILCTLNPHRNKLFLQFLILNKEKERIGNSDKLLTKFYVLYVKQFYITFKYWSDYLPDGFATKKFMLKQLYLYRFINKCFFIVCIFCVCVYCLCSR